MSNRLSGLENTSQTGDVQSYSKFVRLLKIILPLSVLIIIGLLILWPQLSDIEVAPLTDQDLTALQEAKQQNLLLNPVYNTLDEKGQPFSITAKEARQQRNDDKIFLTNPTAEMNDENNTLYLEANQGEYNQDQKTLILSNGVTLKGRNNSVLTTDDLTTSILDVTARSQSPAKLTTDKGVIEGQSVSIDRQKQTTTFQGPAKAVINQ